MKNQRLTFHVTAYASNGIDNGVNLGTAVDLTSGAVIEHVLSVYDRTSGVDLAVFPYNEARCPAVHDEGSLYPMFTYRSGRESMLNREQLKDLLQAYVDGEAEQKKVAETV
jgi:hypothetical protein